MLKQILRYRYLVLDVGCVTIVKIRTIIYELVFGMVDLIQNLISKNNRKCNHTVTKQRQCNTI